MRLLLTGTFCAILFGAWPLAGQQNPAAPVPSIDATAQPLFRSESNLVVLHVNVLDGGTEALADLPQAAFQVFEDDKPQEITFFSSADVPVAVGLVVDNSSSMIARRAMVIAGATAFADSSHAQDEVFAIVFNENVRHGLPQGTPFTQSRTLLQSALVRYSAGGMTALHDAVIAGLDHLQGATHQKRALIVLSDGEDNASRRSESQMLEAVNRSDALIFTVSTAHSGEHDSDPALLRKLARASGGAAYFPRSEEQVVSSFEEIAITLRRGYSIGYTPTNTKHDGRYRRVKVQVRTPDRKNLTVRARDGYTAPNHSHPQ